MSAEIFRIQLGENFTDLNDKASATLNDYDIAKIICHANYEPFSHANDIALIKLARPVEYSKSITPICIPTEEMTSELFQNVRPSTAGWGATKAGVFWYKSTF